MLEIGEKQNLFGLSKVEYTVIWKSKWATTRQNMSLGVSDQARHKPACAATEAS